MKKYLLCLLLGATCLAQQSPYTAAKFQPVPFTATAQTSAALDLSSGIGGVGNSYPSIIISVTGTALTTATFGVTASNDNGSTYNPINVCPILTPSTCAATATATAAGAYVVPNTGGFDHLKIVTSGTFTATKVTLMLTGATNGNIARGGSSGGGFDPASPGPIGGTTPGSIRATTATITGGSSNVVLSTVFGAATENIFTLNGDTTTTGMLGFYGAGNSLEIGAQTEVDFNILGTGVMGLNSHGAFYVAAAGTIPGVDTASPTVGGVACIKTAGPPIVLGVCTSVVGAGGACTCS